MNTALGAALDIARGWLDSKNGNEIMAGKSLLNKHELDFEPEDPREKRYPVKMPKSLSYALSCYRRDGEALRPTPEVEAELKRMSWTVSGASGRVTHATLHWLLEAAEYAKNNETGPFPRAADKFIETHCQDYEKAGQIISDYLAMHAPQEQGAYVEELEGDDPENCPDEPDVEEEPDEVWNLELAGWDTYRIERWARSSGHSGRPSRWASS